MTSKITSTLQEMDKEMEGYRIEDCVNAEGEIDVDVVAGIYYTRAKKLFSEVFQEVLDVQRQMMIADGLPVEKVEKYCIKMNIHRRKPRDPEKACQATCKSGNPCNNNKKDGYDYCGRHVEQQFTGSSYEDRAHIKAKQKGLNFRTASNELDDSSSAPPSYEPKDEDARVARIEKIEGVDYLVVGREVYKLPVGFDPGREVNFDESDLELVGSKKKSTGEMQWLDRYDDEEF